MTTATATKTIAKTDRYSNEFKAVAYAAAKLLGVTETRRTFGISRRAVYNWLRDGVTYDGTREWGADAKAAALLLADAVGPTAAAVALGIGRRTIYRWFAA